MSKMFDDFPEQVRLMVLILKLNNFWKMQLQERCGMKCQRAVVQSVLCGICEVSHNYYVYYLFFKLQFSIKDKTNVN